MLTRPEGPRPRPGPGLEAEAWTLEGRRPGPSRPRPRFLASRPRPGLISLVDLFDARQGSNFCTQCCKLNLSSLKFYISWGISAYNSKNSTESQEESIGTAIELRALCAIPRRQFNWDWCQTIHPTLRSSSGHTSYVYPLVPTLSTCSLHRISLDRCCFLYAVWFQII